MRCDVLVLDGFHARSRLLLDPMNVRALTERVKVGVHGGTTVDWFCQVDRKRQKQTEAPVLIFVFARVLQTQRNSMPGGEASIVQRLLCKVQMKVLPDKGTTWR